MNNPKQILANESGPGGWVFRYDPVLKQHELVLMTDPHKGLLHQQHNDCWIVAVPESLLRAIAQHESGKNLAHPSEQ